MVQAHLLRIVDPVTGQPLTLDRLEDEASIMFVVRRWPLKEIYPGCSAPVEPL